jgi:hypothetical protein
VPDHRHPSGWHGERFGHFGTAFLRLEEHPAEEATLTRLTPACFIKATSDYHTDSGHCSAL